MSNKRVIRKWEREKRRREEKGKSNNNKKKENEKEREKGIRSDERELMDDEKIKEGDIFISNGERFDASAIGMKVGELKKRGEELGFNVTYVRKSK